MCVCEHDVKSFSEVGKKLSIAIILDLDYVSLILLTLLLNNARRNFHIYMNHTTRHSNWHKNMT